MPAPLSIIIPTLNAAAALPLCLEALMPGVELSLIREVVVADCSSTDATVKIAEASGANFITSPKGRGIQLRNGAENARGEWLLFLHADTALSHDWAGAAAAPYGVQSRQGLRSSNWFIARMPKQARWLERRANARAQRMGLPYGDQGLLVSRALYDEVGGYVDVPLMEDVMMVRAIGKRRLAFLNAEARTSAAKYERDGWRKRGWRNAFLLTRFLMGASPEKLARQYS